jgi:transcriptional regulator with XRE-family HTH domain
MKRMNLLYAMDNLLENCKTCEIRGEVKHYNPVKVCNGCKTYKELRDIGDKLGEERKMGKAVKLTMEQYKDYKAKGLTDGQIAEELGCTPNTISNWKKRQDKADKWERSKGSDKPDAEVKTQSETKGIQEDLKAENGRLKRELGVLKEGLRYANEQLADSVTREHHKKLARDLKYELENVKCEAAFLSEEKKKLEADYQKEHSLVIQLDVELENSRDQYKKVISHNVNLTKENEHLRGLVKLWL